MGKCGTADTSVYFALSTLSLGRAAAVKNFRLGLKYLTADVLPNTMQAAKYADGQPRKLNHHPKTLNDFRNQRFDIRASLDDFKNRHFDIRVLLDDFKKQEIDIKEFWNDFKNWRFDIRLFSGDFISGGFDFIFPVLYIKRAGTDINN